MVSDLLDRPHLARDHLRSNLDAALAIEMIACLEIATAFFEEDFACEAPFEKEPPDEVATVVDHREIASDFAFDARVHDLALLTYFVSEAEVLSSCFLFLSQEALDFSPPSLFADISP